MVVRKRKTTRLKQLGERTHGHGDTKNRRGSGNRGGRGRAGSHKHKFSKYYMTFGIKNRQHAAPQGKALNLEQVSEHLAEWIRKGKVIQTDGMWILDGKKVGIGKILGSGTAPSDLRIKRIMVTEKARQKIEESDGEIEEGPNTKGGETKVADPSAGDGGP
ncbi:MAG: uL15m family ribosomal protein [archaeon]